MSLLHDNDLACSPVSGRLIGVDEAGRGALAGPVVVAAVILDPRCPVKDVNDSKKLTPAKREILYRQILDTSLAWHVTEIGADFIDQYNILQATLEGMSRSVAALAGSGDLCLIDGNALPRELPCSARCVIGGDGLQACIAAASIIAKVHRDRLMTSFDADYPQYGFARHKGYGTADHLHALQNHGPCPLHRKSFGPVAQLRIAF